MQPRMLRCWAVKNLDGPGWIYWLGSPQGDVSSGKSCAFLLSMIGVRLPRLDMLDWRLQKGAATPDLDQVWPNEKLQALKALHSATEARRDPRET